MRIALRRRDLCGFAGHRIRARRHDHGRRGMARRDRGVDVVTVVAPSPVTDATGPSTWSSRGPTCEPSSTSLSVNTEATIRPVSASVARCSTLQARRRLVPCFSISHSPGPQRRRPVLSTSRCTGPQPRPNRGFGSFSVAARRLRVEWSGTARSRSSSCRRRWCTDAGEPTVLLLPGPWCQMARMETGFATRIMRLSTSVAIAASPRWAGKMRACSSCEKAGMEPYVPRPQRGSSVRKGLFRKDEFKYDPETDSFTCPAGQRLTPYSSSALRQLKKINYANRKACRDCPLRARCTDNQFRAVSRLENEAVLDRMQDRLAKRPEVLNQRREAVEHPFGSIKQWMNQGAFLMRGLEKVRAEFSLTALAYNIRRVLNLVAFGKLMAAVKAAPG